MDLYMLSRLSTLDVKWAGMHTWKDPFHRSGNANPYHELLMVNEGPVQLQVEHEKMELHSGECILLKPWEMHKNWGNMREGTSFFWVQFAANPALSPFDDGDGGGIPASFPPISEQQQSQDWDAYDTDYLILPRRYQPKPKFKLLYGFESLLNEMNTPKSYYRFRANLLLGHLLETVAEDYLNQHKDGDTAPQTYMIFRRMIRFMNEDYYQNMTSTVFEQTFDRKYEHLCQVFKRYAGISIGTYLQQIRINRAKYLLASGGKTIQSIAEEVGIPDPYYFSRLFKRLEGISPSQFQIQASQQ